MRLASVLTAAVLLTGCGGAPAAGPADARVVSGDVRLDVRSVGDGDDVVVLVHGGPGLSKEAMAPYEALAADGRRVVSYDQRGAGRSSAPADGEYGLDVQVADLDAVRRAAGADRVALVGQSWGGLVAQAYAAAHPGRVRALVVVGAPPLDAELLHAGQARFAAHVAALQERGLVPRELPGEGAAPCAGLEAVLPAYAGDPTDPPQEPPGTSCTPATSGETWADATDPVRMAGAADALARWRGPAVAVMGERDAFGLAWLDRVVASLPGARRVVVPGAGHLVALEQPDAVLAAAAAALDAD